MDPLALIFLTITVTVLAAVLFFLARSYTRVVGQLHESEKAKNELQSQVSEKPVKLLQQANEQAQEIINKANKEASDILASSKTYEVDSTKDMREKLAALEQQQAAVFAKASNDMKLAYQNLITQIQEQDINTLKNMTKD